MRSKKTIAQILRQLNPSRAPKQRFSAAFRQEMSLGLRASPNSLKMLDSMFDCPRGTEHGRFIAVDFGGTNLRASLVELDGNRQARTVRTARSSLKNRQADLTTAPAAEVFEHIASLVGSIIDRDHQYNLGHTFSFPCTQTSPNGARLIKWTKEIAIRDAVDHDINGILHQALRAAGIQNVTPRAILNDTVSTLLAQAYTTPGVSIGSICGTGHNSAFFLKRNGSARAINMECGNFDTAAFQTPFDRMLDERSTTTGQRFEKMVSGAYLPEVYNIIMEHAHPAQHTSLLHSAVELADIASGKSPCHSAGQAIAEALFIRAGSLVAASFHGVLSYIDPGMLNTHTIAIDGSLFTKVRPFARALRRTLREMLGNRHDRVSLATCTDGSTVGAAVAAAMSQA